MTQDEELEYIVALLDEHNVPKTDGLAIFSTYGRVAWLARKAAQQSVQPTLLESGQNFAPESVNPYPCDTN